MGHLVHEESRVAMVGGRPLNRRSGVRGQPQLRHGAQHLHIDGPCGHTGHGPGVGDAVGVRRQIGAFDLASALHDDAVVPDLAAVGQRLPRGDQLIQLDHRLLVEHGGESSGCCWR